MLFGTSLLSYIPLRKEPANSAEMVSQILFGETYCVLDSLENWLFVKIDNDNYEGWIEKKMAEPLDEKSRDMLQLRSPWINPFPLTLIKKSDLSLVHLSPGCELPIHKDSNSFSINDTEFEAVRDEHAVFDYRLNDLHALQRFTQLFLNTPYLWGGRTRFGIDCSGLSQIICKICGIMIPRDAWQQAGLGTIVKTVEETESGDLAFFENNEGKIIHVGIVLDKDRILHSSGFVRVDTLDKQGIYDKNLKYYSHTLKLIKRFV